jgi:hypothetical protein
MSTSLHARVAAGTHLADGKFLKVTGNGEVSKITRNNSNTSNIKKKKKKRERDGQHFKPE